MDKNKVQKIINKKVEEAFAEYTAILGKENNCKYSGDITPMEMAYWNDLISKLADLFADLSTRNKIIESNKTNKVNKFNVNNDKYIMDYSFHSASWIDYGWRDNKFFFSYGDFKDEDGDEFSFLIVYNNDKDMEEKYRWSFYMQYAFDEIACDTLTEEFFLRHMDKKLINSVKEYMIRLMAMVH